MTKFSCRPLDRQAFLFPCLCFGLRLWRSRVAKDIITTPADFLAVVFNPHFRLHFLEIEIVAAIIMSGDVDRAGITICSGSEDLGAEGAAGLLAPKKPPPLAGDGAACSADGAVLALAVPKGWLPICHLQRYRPDLLQYKCLPSSSPYNLRFAKLQLACIYDRR